MRVGEDECECNVESPAGVLIDIIDDELLDALKTSISSSASNKECTSPEDDSICIAERGGAHEAEKEASLSLHPSEPAKLSSPLLCS
tara:strand:- start:1199 stop:1459 length:261 start_codon:yes stop_codon:yes gene_type:complete